VRRALDQPLLLERLEHDHHRLRRDQRRPGQRRRRDLRLDVELGERDVLRQRQAHRLERRALRAQERLLGPLEDPAEAQILRGHGLHDSTSPKRTSSP